MRKIIFITILLFSVFKHSFGEENKVFSTDLTVMTFEEFQPLLTPVDDKIYIFNFWATWCRPCVRELPYFEALHEKYHQKGVEVVLVSLDFVDHLNSHLLPFLERNPKKSKVILLNAPRYNQWIHKVSDEWSGAIPATVFIAQKGNKHHFFQQEFKFEELEEIVLKLIH